MGGPIYTIEQLQHLRNSPLVQKPDGLPSIEQWMEAPADQQNNTTAANRRPRSGPMRDSEPILGGESRSDRPLFSNAGMGNFGRRPSAQPEDTVLGPPKLSFTSASRNAKAAAENAEKRTLPTADGDQISDRFSTRDRWTRDERTRDKPGYTNGRRNAREDGEGGWTNVKSRKSLGQEDFDRGFGRDREKPQKDGDADNNDGASRRTNMAREKLEGRWGRREDSGAKENEGSRFASGQGGWRDRERDRGGDRDRDREWNRGAPKVEEDPEWMDTKAPAEKKPQAKTQEDFQRWKEQMRAKDTPIEEKEETKDLTTVGQASQLPADPSILSALSPAPSKVMTPLGLDPTQEKFFGNWGKDKSQESSAPPPTAAVKERKSKFANMFAKPEEPAKPPPIPAMESPAPGTNGSNDEDKQGFQRILQMLGGASISGPGNSQPPPSAPLNGARQGGGISLDLFQTSQPEEPSEMRQLPGQRVVTRTAEQNAMLENILAPRPSAPESRPSQPRFNTMSPEAGFLEQYGLPRSDSNHPVDDFPAQQPPSRNSSAQDAQLHALLKRQQRDQAKQDRDQQQFLLNLMQPSRATPPQGIPPNLPRPNQENQNLQSLFEQPTQRQQGQPRGRGLPPGFMDDPRIFSDPDMAMRREAERREQANFRAMEEARYREREARLEQQREEALRKNNPRMPPGMYDDPTLAGLQRRNTQGEIPRQMTNMGIPSQPVPDMPYMRGNPGMPPTPQDRNIAPPPGFGALGMRQPPPPGYGGPVPQGGPPGPPQHMGLGPSFSAGNTPLGHPPGIPPNRVGGMGGLFQGQGQGQMPGPPQGYFPPPGYGPPPTMGARDLDPRLMMGGRPGPDFDGFGQGGPPPQGNGGNGLGPRQVGRQPGMF